MVLVPLVWLIQSLKKDKKDKFRKEKKYSRVDCMTQWKVLLEGAESGTHDDIALSFQDTKELMEPPVFERYILEEITKAGKGKDHYSELPNIKEVTSDKGESIATKKTAVVLVTLKETKNKIGILLSLKGKFNFEVRGLRPNNFAKEVAQDNTKVTALLTKLTKEPDAFEDVNIVYPEDRF